MSFNLKNICSWNLDGMPFKNNVFNKIPKWNSFINSQISSFTDEDEDLNIFCVQGLYGYKTGFLGKLFNILNYKLSSYTNTIFIQSIFKIFFKTDSSDLELLSFLISLVSRMIPINNISTFDTKDLIQSFKYKNKNQSYESLFNLNSLFLLEPIFDSGCAIYSNKRPTLSGFEKWDTSQHEYTNKGMVWCYFESYSCKQNQGITIINLDFNINNTDNQDIDNLKQIIKLKNKLEDAFGKELDSYETYIVGNFNIMFNLNTIFTHVDEKLQILKNANLEIINKNSENTSTEFILYGKLKAFEIKEFVDLSSTPQDEVISYSIFYKFNIKTSLPFTINPLVENKHLIKEKKDDNITINPIKIYQTIVRESHFDVKSDTDNCDDWEQVV